MVHLFKELEVLQRRLMGKQVILFLDYDGTLTPIAETPDKAIMAQEMRNVLIGLSGLPRCHSSIISGRKLSDLKLMIDIPNMIYVGSHGYEIEGPAHFHFENLVPIQYEKDLIVIKDLLRRKLSAVPGVWVEDKGHVLTIHYRQATEEATLLAKGIFIDICQGYADQGHVRLAQGKKVLEVCPPVKWDKGEATLWLLSKWKEQLGTQEVLSIYVGDDFTDEDAFSVIKDIGITIHVGGHKPSHAQHYLNNTDEVVQFLEYLYRGVRNE